MEVILLEEIAGLGRRGDLVKVRDGYARNYLLAKGKAVLATPGNRRHFERLRTLRLTRASLASEEAQELAQRIGALHLRAQLRLTPGGKAFGSITKADVVDLLGREGIEVDRSSVEMERPIKEPGEYRIRVRLSPQVGAELRLTIEGVVV